MSGPHIVVVGAGIMGASLAYHLVREGARVTLIDQAPEPATGVSEKSFGWIRVDPDAADPYLALRQQAVSDWHRVERELKGQLQVDWSGALSWWEAPLASERVATKLIKAGYPVRLVDQGQIRRLEPNLRWIPEQAIFAEQEGAIDAKLAATLLVRAACQAGARLQLGSQVQALLTAGSRITGVLTNGGSLPADCVVLASGLTTTSLCLPLGIHVPIERSPAALVSFTHEQPFVNRIISSPMMELRPAGHGLTLAAETVGEPPEDMQAIAQRSLDQIRHHWQGVESMRVSQVVVGHRAIPQGGLPIIGRPVQWEGLYLSVMHAGVTLAAVVGRLAASEIVGDKETNELASYRPIG